MTIKSDFTQQSSYKGLLGWNAYTEALNSKARPAIEIELFLKEHSIPIRQPKTQEVVTAPLFEPTTERDTSVAGVFYGSPELLQVQLSGFLKLTLTPVDKSGTTLSGMSNVTYGDIISMYLQGSINKTIGGAWQRKDPDYFVSPYGNTYTSPVVSIWEPGYVGTTNKWQSFSMTLILEK